MSKRAPTVRLRHMPEYARKAVAMCSDRTREDLDRDEMLRLALTRLIEIIGEAASQVPEEVRMVHVDLPWQDMVGTRHRLVHGYDFVDMDILWHNSGEFAWSHRLPL